MDSCCDISIERGNILEGSQTNQSWLQLIWPNFTNDFDGRISEIQQFMYYY